MSESSKWTVLDDRRPSNAALMFWAHAFSIFALPTLLGVLWFLLPESLGVSSRLLITVLTAMVLVVLLVAYLVAIRRRRMTSTFVSERLGVLRVGRRVVHFSDIDRARLLVSTIGAERCVQLELSSQEHRLRASVILRDYDGRARPTSTAALVGRIIEESAIELPVSRGDPQGNFTRYNYPENITKADALAMALNPPLPGDPLPVLPRL
ncbi:hypothetical protein [Agreia sp.]|uniref:hypothetical protein n=1 Tax=Agreia sp. TaxID=1872416 RepID=UPI0035BBC1CE